MMIRMESYMNPHIHTDSTEHAVETVRMNHISLLAMIILVCVVFFLQRRMNEIMGWFILEGNMLKLMVIARLVVSILLPVLLLLTILRIPVRHALGLYSPTWIKTSLAVLIGFILIFAVNMVLPLIVQPSQKLAEESSSIVVYRNLTEFFLSLLTVSIFASVVDELFFRGVLLRSIMMRYGKIVAIVVTAMLTALFHTFEPFKLLHAFIMGLIFATSVIWTNSVYTSIILHSLHNSLALIPQE